MSETWFIVPAEKHDDLVARAYLARGYSADEARDAARRERDLAILLNEIDETGRLRIENAWHSERDEARRERDEARREVCKARAAISRNSWAAQAKKAGWDNLWEET